MDRIIQDWINWTKWTNLNRSGPN